MALDKDALLTRPFPFSVGVDSLYNIVSCRMPLDVSLKIVIGESHSEKWPTVCTQVSCTVPRPRMRTASSRSCGIASVAAKPCYHFGVSMSLFLSYGEFVGLRRHVRTICPFLSTDRGPAQQLLLFVRRMHIDLATRTFTLDAVVFHLNQRKLFCEIPKSRLYSLPCQIDRSHRQRSLR